MASFQFTSNRTIRRTAARGPGCPPTGDLPDIEVRVSDLKARGKLNLNHCSNNSRKTQPFGHRGIAATLAVLLRRRLSTSTACARNLKDLKSNKGAIIRYGCTLASTSGLLTVVCWQLRAKCPVSTALRQVALYIGARVYCQLYFSLDLCRN